MSEPLLAFSGVTRTFGAGQGEVRALGPLTLTIGEGEFITVAGPSGSGKTTMLNLAGLLDKPSTGEVFLKGAATSPLSGEGRARLRREAIGFVFQEANLLPVLTALENVEFSLLLRGEGERGRRERAFSALELVGVADQADKFPAAMSGGQRQRVAIARAIVSGPSLVIADEPTASLDRETGAGVVALLKRINRDSGTTFLLASHDTMVIDAASRVILLRDGRVVV